MSGGASRDDFMSLDFSDNVLLQEAKRVPGIVATLATEPEHAGKQGVGRRLEIMFVHAVAEASRGDMHDISFRPAIRVQIPLTPTAIAHCILQGPQAQSSTFRPGTSPKSTRLLVITVSPSESAWAAIRRS